MIKLKIDNIDIIAEEGTSVLNAAKQAGIEIPSMCFLEGHNNHPSCMVCLVKDNRNGNLIPSCAMKVAEGMDLSSQSDEVLLARRQSLELLLSDHMGDCEAPCSLACPAGMDIPVMNRHIADGNFTEALETVKEDIALPHILGYICPAPCEKACRRKQIDNAVSICQLKRSTAVEGIDIRIEKLISKGLQQTGSGKRAAIIGSGPAGLAAAYYLLLYGHKCTIFERENRAGGTLRTVIPENELPSYVTDSEIDLIKSMGAEFVLGKAIDSETLTGSIQKSYDAVVLATGDIAGSDLFRPLLETTGTGYKSSEKDQSTSVRGIFICGSAIRPHKMAVRSVAQGKIAAQAAHSYMMGDKFEKTEKMFNSRFDKLMPAEFKEYLKEATDDQRYEPKAEKPGGFTSEEARKEAARCLHCDCRKQRDCKLRSRADEYKIDRKRYAVGERRPMTKQIQHDVVVYEAEKCIRCGLCVEISAEEGEKWGLAFQGRGFDVRITSPLGIAFKEGLTHSAVRCVKSCPTGALSFKEEQKTIANGS